MDVTYKVKSVLIGVSQRESVKMSQKCGDVLLGYVRRNRIEKNFVTFFFKFDDFFVSL